MKRIIDLILSISALLTLSPLLLIVLALVWSQDYKNPFYLAPRVAKGGDIFTMFKVRSMVFNADKNNVGSTKLDDPRITRIGRFVRKFKIDELGQLINVIKGEMSLVGPRPQIKRDVDLYSIKENILLNVHPGITDFASIVFSDEGKILEGANDPDLKYNQVIRPWKSRLGILYVENRSILLDIKLILLTILVIFSRAKALSQIQKILKKISSDDELISVASRKKPLYPHPPPGLDKIVTSR